MAGVTWWNFYFRLFPGAIRSPQVVQFLGHLLRHLDCKLLVVWDGARTHRSRLVWGFVREQKGRLWLEFLPAYAPELNPVDRVSLVSLEAARITELLPADFLATEPLCPPSFASDAQANYFGHRILGTVATVLVSLYYVILNR